MNKSLFAFAVLLMAVSHSAQARCDLSAFHQFPAVPSAQESTLEELIQARDSVQHYINNAEQALRSCDFESLRHNYYLSSIRQVADLFNQQVKVFRSL